MNGFRFFKKHLFRFLKCFLPITYNQSGKIELFSVIYFGCICKSDVQVIVIYFSSCVDVNAFLTNLRTASNSVVDHIKLTRLYRLIFHTHYCTEN